MIRHMAKTAEQRAQALFADAQQRWREALEAHRTAPPDAGFSARLAALADAARAEAGACREAEANGFEWPPHRATESRPPYELQPGSGRRGPTELWHRFDGAVAELNRVAAGTDLLDLAEVYEVLAEIAAQLAQAVEREDRASGLLPRPRARRSAYSPRPRRRSLP
jgi:hypothetical protein